MLQSCGTITGEDLHVLLLYIAQISYLILEESEGLSLSV